LPQAVHEGILVTPDGWSTWDMQAHFFTTPQWIGGQLAVLTPRPGVPA